MVKQEWKELFHNTWFKIVLLAIIIIPCIYAGVFLGSMWDPYGNSGSIPVAVVNMDKEVIYNQQTLNVGQELVDNLKTNNSMKFDFVDEKKAKQGLENGSYYMIITIPSDFSSNATTLLNKQPKKMILHYTTHPGSNYIASKMDDSAIAKIKEEVSRSITKTYAKTIFEQVKTLSSGLKEAADGSYDLSSGVNQLAAGGQTISKNLKLLSASSLSFQDGSQTLTKGLKDYTQATLDIHNGAYSLKGGLDKLNASTDSLTKGISQLDTGAQNLNSGIQQYVNGVNQVYFGSKQLVSNDQILIKATQDLSSASSTLKQLNEKLNLKLQDYSQHINTDINEANKDMQMIETLQQNITIITNNMDASLNGGNSFVIKDNQVVSSISIPQEKTFVYGINAYIKGVNELHNGIDELNDKGSVLIEGSQAISKGSHELLIQTPSIVNGIDSLDQGANALYQGTNQLTHNNSLIMKGINGLNVGAGQISQGASKLADGSSDLSSGLNSAKNGSITLNNSLSEGAKKSTITTNDDTLSMLSSPIETSHNEISTVENNGHAMAPYMMSVALYVACLAFALMYPLLKDINKAKSGFKYWLSKSSVWFFCINSSGTCNDIKSYDF